MQVVEDIYFHAMKKQTGVSLKYMLDFGSNPFARQMVLSAQFLHVSCRERMGRLTKLSG